MHPKQLRILRRALNELFSPKSFCSDPEKLEGIRFITGVINLKDGRQCFLSNDGYSQVNKITDLIDRWGELGNNVVYSDIHSAVRTVFDRLIVELQQPDDESEFLKLVREELESKIERRTFVFPIFGVEVEESNLPLDFGSFHILKPTSEALNAMGLPREGKYTKQALEMVAPFLVLVGKEEGTSEAARKKFEYRAKLFTGVLAIVAAANYERGASGFRIGTATSPETSYGSCVSLTWGDKNNTVEIRRSFVRAQPLNLNASFQAQSAFQNIVHDALRIINSDVLNEIEMALKNAIYWFSDAHLDLVPEMQLVKYFSCVEAFFSLDQKDITNRLSNGLAFLVSRSGFVLPSEYEGVRKKLAKYYGYRSSAVHRGKHAHVSRLAIAEISQWTAWGIITMLLIATRRKIERLEQLRVFVEEFERQQAQHRAQSSL